MPEQVIRCEEKAQKIRSLEIMGNIKVDSCEPIKDKPGWCLLIWHFV